MKFFKKVLSLLMVLIIAASVSVLPADFSAAQQDTAQVSSGASDIVNYASSLVGKTKAQLGYSIEWCAAFVADCAASVGQASAIPYSTYAQGIYNNILNAGGYIVSSAQAGDIVVYKCTVCQKMCHVGIMVDSQNSIQGNIYAGSISYVKNIKYTNYIDSCGAASLTACYNVTFLRPNYTDSRWCANMTGVDIGDDVYASIVKNDSGVYLGVSQGNVQLVNVENVSQNSVVWKFDRQSDGSYVIYNCETGAALDVSNEGKTEGTNIATYTYWGSDAQKWYIYGSSNGQYILKPKLCDLVLDVSGGYNDYGTNVQLWSYNNSAAQQMKLEFKSAVKAPTLSVEAGDYKTLTAFSFTSTDFPLYYKLVINKITNGTSAAYDTIDMIRNDYFMYELPVGEYEVYAEAYNGFSSAKSNVVTFEVVSAPVVADDGWTYSEKLYSNVNSANYEIQYLHTYSTIASESPGAGWTKGAYAKTEYVNSGDPYWSNIELATSDTRVLVNYIYYHYCSGSKGLEVNYEGTATFGHYDWLSKDGVYEYSAANDYADSRYKFYHLKWSDGSDAYCNSSVSCDGAYGSHGNRSYYWYRSSQYQDKAAVDYYYYTKPAQWTSVYDSSATDVTYRYKLKENSGLVGDANGDGRVTIADATTIQKYVASLITLSDDALLLSDVDGNGRVNVIDATKIQKYLAGIITAL